MLDTTIKSSDSEKVKSLKRKLEGKREICKKAEEIAQEKVILLKWMKQNENELYQEAKLLKSLDYQMKNEIEAQKAFLKQIQMDFNFFSQDTQIEISSLKEQIEDATKEAKARQEAVKENEAHAQAAMAAMINRPKKTLTQNQESSSKIDDADGDNSRKSLSKYAFKSKFQTLRGLILETESDTESDECSSPKKTTVVGKISDDIGHAKMKAKRSSYDGKSKVHGRTVSSDADAYKTSSLKKTQSEISTRTSKSLNIKKNGSKVIINGDSGKESGSDAPNSPVLKSADLPSSSSTEASPTTASRSRRNTGLDNRRRMSKRRQRLPSSKVENDDGDGKGDADDKGDGDDDDGDGEGENENEDESNNNDGLDVKDNEKTSKFMDNNET